MSEIDYSVFDEDIDMHPPELDGPGEYLLEVKSIIVKETRKAGLAMFGTYIVRESSHKGSPVGSLRSYKQFDIDGKKYPDSKGIKQRNVRGFIAACANVDPTSKQKWAEVVQYASKKNVYGQNFKDGKGNLHRGGAGVLIRCKTQSARPTRGNTDKKFVEHAFSPNVEE
jgi:hypothetical protein